MPYTRESIPDGHSEFNGGNGLIDPLARRDRVGLTAEERLREIYATNPASAGADGDPARVAVPRKQFVVEDEG